MKSFRKIRILQLIVSAGLFMLFAGESEGSRRVAWRGGKTGRRFDRDRVARAEQHAGREARDDQACPQGAQRRFL